jgi:hypothetical protein
MTLQPIVRQSAILDFEANLLGELIRPAHDDYDLARRVHNLNTDRRPALIARAADAADVLRSVAFAREYDLPLAVRSGGHSLAGYGTVEGGLVIDLSRMQGLSIDPERRIAWAQPGLTWGQYAEQANVYGLATTAGDTASVGLGGLTLGGGIGWMARKHGLTVDNLLSVEIVTADGRLVRASTEERPDLFWALRGGGGNFGVATAFQYRLQPAGTIFGGAVIYPVERDILRGWSEYVAQAPDELTSIAFITAAPPAPFVPADQVGKPVMIVAMVCVGDIPNAERVVAPLRRLGTPIVDIARPMQYPEMFTLTAGATHPGYASHRSGFLPSLPDAVQDMVIDQATTSSMAGRIIELRGLGGAMARIDPTSTAFVHRDKPYMLTLIGATQDPAQLDAQRTWTTDTWDLVRPYTSGAYVNFLEDEGADRVFDAYPAATYERLSAIKRQYDPSNVFRMNQNIASAP